MGYRNQLESLKQSYLTEFGNCSAKSSLNLEYFSNVRICVQKSTFQACSKY